MEKFNCKKNWHPYLHATEYARNGCHFEHSKFEITILANTFNRLIINRYKEKNYFYQMMKACGTFVSATLYISIVECTLKDEDA